MKNNKKGLSTIVATLLIILLTLVAVGIIWVVVKKVIDTGASTLDYDAMCLETEVRATQATNLTGAEAFDVTLQRTGGDAELGGVKLVFTNADEQTSYPVDVPGSTYPLAALATITVPVTVPIDTLLNPNKVSVVVYFIDESGKEKLCPTATQLAFNL
jgi:hypothetical protein